MSNSLAKVHPELVSEWAERNFPLTPDDITYLYRFRYEKRYTDNTQYIYRVEKIKLKIE